MTAPPVFLDIAVTCPVCGVVHPGRCAPGPPVPEPVIRIPIALVVTPPSTPPPLLRRAQPAPLPVNPMAQRQPPPLVRIPATAIASPAAVAAADAVVSGIPRALPNQVPQGLGGPERVVVRPTPFNAAFHRWYGVPCAIDPGLAAFVTRVYYTPRIMRNLGDIANSIYNMYTAFVNEFVDELGDEDRREYIDAIASAAATGVALQVLTRVHLQGTDFGLGVMQQYADMPQYKPEYDAFCKKFIYFDVANAPRVPVGWRTYVNVKWYHMHDAVEAVCEYIKRTPTHGIREFKVSSAKEVGTRLDGMVIYSFTAKNAVDAVGALEHLPNSAFDDEVPAMTEKLARGVSRGVHPQGLITDFDAAGRGKKYSYGSLRAEAIAGAVRFFLAHVRAGDADDTLNEFKQHVAAAFRACGLNPSRAGSPPLG